MALTIAGVLALQELMKRENIDGTLQIWPGIAEEALAGKMWMIDAGVLEEADAVIFSHVGNSLSTQWGLNSSTAMVSVEYSFQGVTSHAAGAPWVGRSALDAVELMNTAWNFRREHLHPNQRSHYVITNGGLQPNIVPENASVWYYFRHNTTPQVQEMLEIADGIAEGASLMTGATWKRTILGSTWPIHSNKALAEAMQVNIEAVGMPDWSEDDQAYAKAVQESLGAAVVGLRTEVTPLAGPIAAPSSGGSDDIGQVTWVKPTVRLSFPSNIAGAASHNWQAALSMATPIAHKGNIQAAKVLAMTTLDLLLKPDLIEAANAYFAEQTKTIQYYSLEGPDDVPSIHLNAENDGENRPKQEEFYYDETKYDTYLEQLGVAYPMTQK
jgi:aminobenzoyl-glutamate utilization protein B